MPHRFTQRSALEIQLVNTLFAILQANAVCEQSEWRQARHAEQRDASAAEGPRFSDAGHARRAPLPPGRRRRPGDDRSVFWLFKSAEYAW